MKGKRTGPGSSKRGMGNVVLELTASAPVGLRERIPGLNPRMTLWLQMMNNHRAILGVDDAGEKHPKGLGVGTAPGCLGLHPSSTTCSCVALAGALHLSVPHL